VLGLLWLIRYLPERTYLVHAAQRPNGAMRLHHLGDLHPTKIRPYFKRMETEDIATVAAETSEVVEENTDAGTTCKEISETCSGVINAIF
jgi:hypothetical protein